MDPSIDSLNYCPETSTKFKLKLDHSTIQIAVQKRNNKSAGSEETFIQKPQHPNHDNIITNESQHVLEKHYMEHEQHYLTKMISLNFDLLETKNRLSHKRLCEMTVRQNLPGNQFITSHQLPLFLKTMDGNLFYDSNDKFEPQSMNIAHFLSMNIKNENSNFNMDKGGIHSFAPRRRRRGTGKLIKK